MNDDVENTDILRQIQIEALSAQGQAYVKSYQTELLIQRTAIINNSKTAQQMKYLLDADMSQYIHWEVDETENQPKVVVYIQLPDTVTLTSQQESSNYKIQQNALIRCGYGR